MNHGLNNHGHFLELVKVDNYDVSSVNNCNNGIKHVIVESIIRHSHFSTFHRGVCLSILYVIPGATCIMQSLMFLIGFL